MRSYLAVVPTPAFDHYLRINSVSMLLQRETLVAELAVYGLIGSVLQCIPGTAQRAFDSLAQQLPLDCPRHGLRGGV